MQAYAHTNVQVYVPVYLPMPACCAAKGCKPVRTKGCQAAPVPRCHPVRGCKVGKGSKKALHKRIVFNSKGLLTSRFVSRLLQKRLRKHGKQVVKMLTGAPQYGRQLQRQRKAIKTRGLMKSFKRVVRSNKRASEIFGELILQLTRWLPLNYYYVRLPERVPSSTSILRLPVGDQTVGGVSLLVLLTTNGRK